MIKNFFITGDTHGGFNTMTRVNNIARSNPELKPEETGVIILGDCGLNFYLNKTDKKYKKMLNNTGYHIYCVRGNHEERPENIETYHPDYDKNVQGEVWIEDEFPNIKFFKDGGIYSINGYRTLVIGGAYSIDKWYRLGGLTVEENNPKETGWFNDEMLTTDEMNKIYSEVNGQHFNLILTHTCPISNEPTDLFLNFIDQSTVDKSMEQFLEKIKNNVLWDVWLFGHYHADRIEAPSIEMFFTDYQDLKEIMKRWAEYRRTGDLDWWLEIIKETSPCEKIQEK